MTEGKSKIKKTLVKNSGHLPTLHQSLMDLAESQHEATQSKDIFILYSLCSLLPKKEINSFYFHRIFANGLFKETHIL